MPDTRSVVHAVRTAYGARAQEYTELLGAMESISLSDVAAINGWARHVDGAILDAGCGPGHWTKHLRDRGADVVGVDMVQEFVELARARFAGVPFSVGRLEALPVETDALTGLLAWYSVIHSPPSIAAEILTEFARCLRPGGSLLLGFFTGLRFEPFDHAVATAYFWPVDAMARLLRSSGFDVVDVQTREDPGVRPHAAITAEFRG
ncbi:class I SAM-dependent methyltransferase [Tomitella gaofuii]|uniref:class I SAM-dependent methyltransferase n=1 Tax=Tomitella gaofuii TaxID=2760083 RepID=UPI001F428F13|nr:class I SAM-dependent methyltransferase [Tomitella gaofuii]